MSRVEKLKERHARELEQARQEDYIASLLPEKRDVKTIDIFTIAAEMEN